MKTKNKTSSIIKINQKRCKGCLFCIEVCPRNCLVEGRTMNVLGYHPVEYTGEGCTGCGMCFQMCPDVCIEIKNLK